jgi:HEAT repeat protein
MQLPTDKILALLAPAHPLDVRCAAAVVLGEVGGKDAELFKGLCERLEDEQPALRLAVIKAVGKLRIEKALPQLLERIKQGGEEADQAAQAAARLGAKGTRALQELMPKVAPGLRRYIASALAAGGNTSSETAAVAVLLDKDPGVVEAAVRSLIGQVPTLGAGHRKTLADQLLHLLENEQGLSAASDAAAVRLLAALDDPRAEKILWDRILPPYSAEMRGAALQRLGRWGGTPNKEQLSRLFTCAADRDFRVAAPALMILQAQPVNDKTLAGWVSLLHAPDVAARRAALDKLGERDSAEVAEALVGQVGHPDRSLRDAALARLTRLKHGREALTRALLDADTADRAWLLAKAQSPIAKDAPAAWRETVFKKACAHVEANDRRSDALLYVLREADAAWLRDRLEQRALTLRKKEDYATALLYLRLLARDPACGFPTRLELAACGLKTSAHDLSAEARDNDPCLIQFGHLCQNYEAELGEQLEKIDWLAPEDLHYLGFHFAEREGRQKQFAAKVLGLVVKRSPRSKLGQAAKAKLRSAGLD